MKAKQLLFLSCLGFAIAPTAVFAHSLETNYQLVFDSLAQQDSLELQAVLSNGENYPEAPIVVYSPANPDEPWLETTTDQDGKFTFSPDPSIPGEWAVEIGEDSHWDRLEIPVGAQNINLDAISQINEHNAAESNHLARQIIVVALVLSSALGSLFVSRRAVD